MTRQALAELDLQRRAHAILERHMKPRIYPRFTPGRLSQEEQRILAKLNRTPSP